MGFSDRVRALKAIYEGSPDSEPSLASPISVAEQNILEAYHTIYAYLDERLKNSHIFNAFRLYLVKRIYLISIDVDESKDVAMAFEVINDRGIPLKPYEILKGKILGVIAKSEVPSYVDTWEKSINQIADNYGDDDVDDFLSIYFQSKYTDTALNYRDLHRDKYHKTIYLEEFDKRIGLKNGGAAGASCNSNIKRFVNETLPFFSDLYCHIIEDSYVYLSEDKITHTWFNSINEQDYQYYLTFAAINPGDPEREAKYQLITKEFDRLYTMLNLTGSYRSNEFAAAVILMGKEIRGNSCDDIKKIFDSKLLEMINKAQGRTDITDPFKYELFANTEYRILAKRFMRYFFARIDHFIADGSGLFTGTYYSLISQAKGKDVYHIEHILANDENHHNISLFIDDEHFIAQRNRLGGLLLLKGADNQSSGNELYEDKLKTYVGNGTLFAQTLLPDFIHSNTGFKAFAKKHNLDFKTYKKFDGTSIEERQKLLFEMVKIIWKCSLTQIRAEHQRILRPGYLVLLSSHP